MVNIRITRPVLTQSLRKSIDQRSFGFVAAGLATAPFQRIRRRCRMRMAKPSSRYSRYTRLWFTSNPFAHQDRCQSAIAEAHPPPRQFLQALPQFAVVPCFPLPVPLGRSCQAHQPAGVPFAHLVLLHRVTRGCPKSRRLYQFFESTSFSARLSNVKSATTCFSFRFSSSSCFSFLASPLSIPPYFAFQR